MKIDVLPGPTSLVHRARTALARGALRLPVAGLMLAALLAAMQPASAQAPGASDCPPQPTMPSAERLAQLQREARDHGFLWRVTRDGHSSYLFGTLHVGRLEWVMPGPRLKQAIEGTDTLAVEVDVTDPAQAAVVARSADAVPSLALPAELADRLARVRALACMGDLMTAAHPLLQATTAMALDARRDGLEPGFGQEFMLIGAARSLKRPVVSLETALQQLQALVPAQAEEAHETLADTLDQIESGKSRRMMGRVAEVWAAGRLDDLARWREWCECGDTPAEQAQLHRMLDARNPAMAERVDALHREGRRVLAAVGALHMVGPHGLPSLLAQRGYTVERITFAPM